MALVEKAGQVMQGGISSLLNTTGGGFGFSSLTDSMSCKTGKFLHRVSGPSGADCARDSEGLEVPCQRSRVGIPMLVQSEGAPYYFISP